VISLTVLGNITQNIAVSRLGLNQTAVFPAADGPQHLARSIWPAASGLLWK
jgi:hypothetical protein